MSESNARARTLRIAIIGAGGGSDVLAAIRNDKPLALNAEIEIGHKSTLLCHLGNIAHRTGRTMNCNPQNGHILGDTKAMALWERDYEKGWEPKV